MVARHYYRFDPEEDTEEVPNVLRWGYALAQNAEEGQAGMYEVVVDDPEMSMDFVGHRRWTVYEDESEPGNQILVDGLTQAVSIAHTGGDITNPVGRVWTIEIADLNTLWTYRVMTGSDSQFPEQTDVERMQQLADSEEMSYFDDFSLLSTASPVTLDKLNGRGMNPAQVADTCAQSTGKNWYIYSTGTRGEVGADIGIWYGRDSLTAYESPLSLSNDPADLDMPAVNAGTATTYPIGADTVLRRDYARQYSGAYGEYQNGAKYVVNTETLSQITLSGRDMTHPAPEIKTGARMERRLIRQLADHATPDEVVSMTVTLPANKVVQLRAGMRVFTTMTHEPGYEAGKYLRVMSAKPSPVGNWYTVALELQGPGSPGTPAASCSTVIAGGESNYELGLETDPNPTVGITPAVNTVLFAWLAAANQNSTGSTDMDPITGGYSELLDEPGDSKSTYRIAAKSATGGVLSTAASSFTPGFSASGGWMAVQVGLPLASASPVQTKYGPGAKEATLDAPPTTGNVVLVFAHLDSGWGLLPNSDPDSGPTTGWVQLFNHDWDVPGNTRLNMAVFARCVEAGETGEYAFSQTKVGYSTARSIFIAEYAP